MKSTRPNTIIARFNLNLIQHKWRVVVSALFLAWAMPSQADILTVDGSDSVVDGFTGNGQCSLPEAIENANAVGAPNSDCPSGSVFGDVIEITTDIALTTTIDATDGNTGTESITSEITINGNGHTLKRDSALPACTGGIVSTNFRLLRVTTGGDLTVNNLNLENGCAQGNGTTGGGGIFSDNDLTINNSTFYQNKADTDLNGEGGAIMNYGGTLTVANSTFSANQASFGGAIENRNSGLASINNSTFYNNTGVAVDNFGGTVETLSNSFFFSNTGTDCSGVAPSVNDNDNINDGSCAASVGLVTAADININLLDNGCTTPGSGGCVKTHALPLASVALDIGGCERRASRCSK